MTADELNDLFDAFLSDGVEADWKVHHGKFSLSQYCFSDTRTFWLQYDGGFDTISFSRLNLGWNNRRIMLIVREMPANWTYELIGSDDAAVEARLKGLL